MLKRLAQRGAGSGIDRELGERVRGGKLGVVVVDALSWGDADDGLIERWDSLPEWPQMVLRALMFRLAVHALHPRSTAAAFPGLARTASEPNITPIAALRACGVSPAIFSCNWPAYRLPTQPLKRKMSSRWKPA